MKFDLFLYLCIQIQRNQQQRQVLLLLSFVLVKKQATKGIPIYTKTDMTATIRPDILEPLIIDMSIGSLVKSIETAIMAAFLVSNDAAYRKNVNILVNRRMNMC